MKNKLWLIQIPVFLLFTSCYLIVEEGFRGQLVHPFLRRTAYPILNRATNALTNFKFTLRGTQPLKNRIVVIEVDNPSITSIGRWPWHRDLMALLIEKTMNAGAKTVGLDIVFSEPDTRVPLPSPSYFNKKIWPISFLNLKLTLFLKM